MRRLLALSVAAVAAFVTPAGAHPPDSPVPCYGVHAGGTEAGVCAGVWCPDLCLIVVDPYCTSDVAAKYCTLVDSIG